MRAAIIQHEKSIPAGTTLNWLQSRQIDYQTYSLFENANLPSSKDFDLLIVCGGSMNVDQEVSFPWLIREKQFIKKTILEKIPIVGLCLGAQLIAEALGGTVGKQSHAEVGWHSVNLLHESSPNQKSITVFQWHEYTFSLPAGCTRLATNENCINQAFAADSLLLGFQFHPEATPEWILTCASNPDLPAPTQTVQTFEQIKMNMHYQPILQNWYFTQLDLFVKNHFRASRC